MFRKQDDTVEGSNCDEVERTESTPTTANYSPEEEIQSDAGLAVVSPSLATPSLATEDDKQHIVPICISEKTEEATSNVIAPGDCQSDGCNAYNAQNQIMKTTAGEVRWTN